ncbi:hypothetical protein TNCT_622771 [Trichonephila clavata]|uniref:Uncharacterized protein n=1 Tax=Trichonephila clavata TaxID=2740835 RepID=A0A8X6H465_TRICU|nr:hypothetical protein TNCT_622771 [Trichonephila clavata]
MNITKEFNFVNGTKQNVQKGNNSHTKLFGVNGSINHHSCTCWAADNLQVRAEHYVNLTGVTVWYHLSVFVFLIRPFYFDHTVNVAMYLNFLKEIPMPCTQEMFRNEEWHALSGWNTSPLTL